MVEYIEPLLKQLVWYWLEEEKGMEVEGEVETGEGRIDLVARTEEDEYYGVELKSRVGKISYEQANRYVDNGLLDGIYFASRGVSEAVEEKDIDNWVDRSKISQTSNKLGVGVKEGMYSVDDVMDRLRSELTPQELNIDMGSQKMERYIKGSVELNADEGSEAHDAIPLEEGVTRIKRALPGINGKKPGFIDTPLSVTESDDGNIFSTENNLIPEKEPKPSIVRDSPKFQRSDEPEFNRRGEPWVRHCVWREYGGIPEGHIPNTMESDTPYRPIDILSFEGSYDPTDAIENPEDNKIIGVEAKGTSSYSPDRVIQQLTEFLETSTLSQLFLAVPDSLKENATNLLNENNDIDGVGLITVTKEGHVEVIRESTLTQPEHDGYLEKQKKRKVGFGEIDIGGKDVVSPYITDEEEDRLMYSDASEYATGIITDNSDIANEDGIIEAGGSTDTQGHIDEIRNNNRGGRRGYLIKGKAAHPSIRVDTEGHPDEDSYWTVTALEDDSEARASGFGRDGALTTIDINKDNDDTWTYNLEEPVKGKYAPEDGDDMNLRRVSVIKSGGGIENYEPEDVDEVPVRAVEREEPKVYEGYIRVTISEFSSDGVSYMLFDFGAKPDEGGYIWFNEEELDELQRILNSIETIEEGKVSGQGDVFDLEAYLLGDKERKKYRPGNEGEERLDLSVSSQVDNRANCEQTDVVAVLEVGQGDMNGASVKLTKAQWFDLISTIDLLRKGKERQLPGPPPEGGYSRIGPSGKAYDWDIGKSIESEIDPDPPSEQ
jgi:hypothetical protein